MYSRSHISTQAASIRCRCRLLNSVRKNSSSVSCLRSRPNHSGWGSAWRRGNRHRYSSDTKGAFAGFGLDGAALKPDESGNKALYGKKLTNSEIVQDGTKTPVPAETLIAKLTEESNR
jgi:hypothetical protein